MDLAIIGAGAAGLTAAIWAGRTFPHAQIALLDSAHKLGAKILVSGGTRCNVTHDQVDETAYAGSSRNSIKKVLKRFDVPQTINFFRELGVSLKREETGKLFPTTDSARTVVNALLSEIDRYNIDLLHPRRVEQITPTPAGFEVIGPWGQFSTRRVILATGGKSLPKSGSDGHGYQLARTLGHHPTDRIFPALVPLTLPKDHFICSLSGLTLPTTLEVRSGSGKKIVAFTNSTLCTHFGLSGPSVLDISRYYTAAKLDDPTAQLLINWLPSITPTDLDHTLQKLGKTTLLRHFSPLLPERLLRTLCAAINLEPGLTADRLTREQRRALVMIITDTPLPITGDRGYQYAEVTAGGIPLTEIRLETMESRITPGLYFCGEICDVDGQIGGYNFQWAWASGYVAGISTLS